VFNKKISAYASYSTGYKAPVSSYFFIVTPVLTTPPTPATGRVNGVLKPEKGAQFEIGSKGALLKDRLAYQLALFSTKYTDKMTSVAVPLNNSVTAYSYVVNGGEQNHKGIELSLKYAVVKNPDAVFTNITPFVNLAYSDFKYGDDFKFVSGSTVANRDTFNYSGLNVFGVPKFMSAEGIDFTMKVGFYGSISHLYKGGVNFAIEKTSNTPKVFTLRTSESYHLFNAKFGYRKSFGSHVDLDVYAGINNMAGIRYPIMVFVNQLPDAYVPAPPNAVYFGGLNIRYNF
jgi:iron complex outermembrane receptor protein